MPDCFNYSSSGLGAGRGAVCQVAKCFYILKGASFYLIADLLVDGPSLDPFPVFQADPSSQAIQGG